MRVDSSCGEASEEAKVVIGMASATKKLPLSILFSQLFIILSMFNKPFVVEEVVGI